MKFNQTTLKFIVGLGLGAASLVAAAQTFTVTLSGTQEVPPVTNTASATGNIKVDADGTISGTITTMGVEGTMAHVHEAAAGQNGPAIVMLTKTSDMVWTIPAGTKLTESQLQSLKSGKLYLNVHSAANKSGALRAQLKP